jgi:predicted RNase H-like HicB family nuclease
LKTLKEIKPIKYYLGLNYPITIYNAEEGGYVAEIEDLPGCLTEGETLEEVTQRIENARNAWIQTAYEDGTEIPLPRTDEEYSGKFMVRIPKYLHRRLSEKARREGVSLNQYIESILSAGVSTQNVIEGLIAGLEKITKQAVAHKVQLVSYPMSYSGTKWMMDEVEEESLVSGLRGITSKELIAV